MEGVNFRFFLDFKNDNTGRIEISEPLKFDGASFTLEQDKGRYGRDITFGNEEVSLRFEHGYYEPTDIPITLPNGEVIYYLTMGLDFLLDYYNVYGSEAEINFIIEKDGLEFTVGSIDFSTAKTDESTYLECKIIQETDRAIVNRRADTKIDVFSDKNMDLQTITPATTTNILLQAKPILQISEWYTPVEETGSIIGNANFNAANGVLKYGIDSTLSYIGGGNSQENFRYLLAKNQLSNVNVEISDIDFSWAVLGDVKLVIKVGVTAASAVAYEFGYTTSSHSSFQSSVNKLIPLIIQGEYLYIYFVINGMFGLSFKKMNVKITATSTAIDSVIKGVRDIDVKKQAAKSINGSTVYAPRFDVGGEHYDNFLFNGKLIRQFDNKPFYVDFKTLMSDLQETNCDYQNIQNQIYINEYPDFYPNKELNAFLQGAADDFSSSFNERYGLVNIEYKYKTYAKDRESSNTIDGVHTESQYLTPNKLADGVKKIGIELIRDPFQIEDDRKQNVILKDTTALDSDDKVYAIDCVQIAPGTTKTYTLVLSQFIDPVTGFLKLLNSNGTDEGTFNWTTLGFNVGNTFKILTGANIGWYTVQAIEATVLTISAGGGSFTGVSQITIEYPLTNVLYKNRTNEGFTLIENLESGDNFSNLRYTIRRNLLKWDSYMATAAKYKPLGTISNTFFKNNGLLRTQFGGGTIYQENENILVSSLPEAILSPKLYNFKVIADFEAMVTLLSDLNTINPDGTIGGFIRVVDVNGKVLKLHPTKLDYEWSSGILKGTGEARNESDYVTIDTLTPLLVKIDEVGYDSIILSNEWYNIKGNYVTLFDANSIPLISPARIDKIKVNGVLYSSGTDLAIALSNL